MSKPQVIALDLDHTLWITADNRPHPSAWDVIDRIHERGFQVLIFSCNNVPWIRKICDEHNLRVDYIWGEDPDDVCKPLFSALIDDRAVGFRGDWDAALNEAFELVAERPVKDYRGPQYLGNPKRKVD